MISCTVLLKSNHSYEVNWKIIPISVSSRLYIWVCYLGLDELICQNVDKDASGLWFCLQCNFSSNKKGNVQSHVEAKHVITQGVSCDVCGTICPTRKALSMHNFRKHRVLWILLKYIQILPLDCRVGWIDRAMPGTESGWLVALPLLRVQLCS